MAALQGSRQAVFQQLRPICSQLLFHRNDAAAMHKVRPAQTAAARRGVRMRARRITPPARTAARRSLRRCRAWCGAWTAWGCWAAGITWPSPSCLSPTRCPSRARTASGRAAPSSRARQPCRPRAATGWQRPRWVGAGARGAARSCSAASDAGAQRSCTADLCRRCTARCCAWPAAPPPPTVYPHARARAGCLLALFERCGAGAEEDQALAALQRLAALLTLPQASASEEVRRACVCDGVLA